MRVWPPHLRPVSHTSVAPPSAASAAPEQRETWDGVTAPSRRGGSTRFLTDVLIELGYCDRDRVEAAIAEARSAGVPPEKTLLEQHAITQEQLSRAIAERYGLDHLDLGVFKVDMAAVNLITASAAKRYNAVPVACSAPLVMYPVRRGICVSNTAKRTRKIAGMRFTIGPDVNACTSAPVNRAKTMLHIAGHSSTWRSARK